MREISNSLLVGSEFHPQLHETLLPTSKNNREKRKKHFPRQVRPTQNDKMTKF
jgi:hypothetical protein